MADQTANREPNRQEGKQAAFPAKGGLHYYRGELAQFDADGYLNKAGDDAGTAIAGVVTRETDLTDSSDGEDRVEVYREGIFEFVYAGTATQADVGSEVTAVDSQTVDLAADTTNDIVVGRIVEFVSATKVRVAIRTS